MRCVINSTKSVWEESLAFFHIYYYAYQLLLQNFHPLLKLIFQWITYLWTTWVNLFRVIFLSSFCNFTGRSLYQFCLCDRLEEKLSNLESENKVLRQQALAMAQNNKLLSRSSRSMMQVNLAQTVSSKCQQTWIFYWQLFLLS